MTQSTTKRGSEQVQNCRWDRDKVASNIIQFEEMRSEKSQRQAAEEMGVPRSTLQHWLKRKNELDVSPAVAAFFESPDGLAVLHRIVIAAQFILLLVSNGSIRIVCLFLELSGLDAFVAGSYGTQQKVAVAMEQEVVSFGEQERNDLAPKMAPKNISACEDETFHPDVCLVAIEPISNFIILEQYAEKRDAKTWTDNMTKALSGFPVNVIQVTSDEAKGLLRHTQIELGIHHSPDLFHGLREISKGVIPALSSQSRRDQEKCDKATQETERLMKKRQDWENQPKCGSEEPPDFEKCIRLATWQEAVAEVTMEITLSRKERVQEILREIGDAYHPFNLSTGTPRQAEQVEKLLESQFSVLYRIAKEASLSDRSIKHIDKARRLVPSMLETITFFWHMVSVSLKELSLSQEVERAVRQNLIPAYYLQYAADKAKLKEQKQAIQTVKEQLLAPLRVPHGPFSGLERSQIQQLELVAKECAGFFQRSSSCVEGRNGQLSLRHHNQHNISQQKLTALTVVHNYFIKRPDGTTAAERFFGHKPRDLFNHLLDRVDLPARPAKRRSKSTTQPWLVAV